MVGRPILVWLVLTSTQGIEVIQQFSEERWATAGALGQSLRRSRDGWVALALLMPQKCSSCLEYPFAKYNIQNPVYTYSQDEYNRFLDTANRSATPKDGKIEIEKPWTKELTDKLFKLYQEYDGRWHVIWDRADFPPDAGFDLEVSGERHCLFPMLKSL